MIPIRDHLPTRTTPWLVRILVVLNVLAFALVGAGETAVQTFGAYAYQLTGAEPTLPPGWPADFDLPPARFEPWRVITHMFMHGGLMHLLGNMWFLWLFGDNVEDRLGRGRFALLYATAGLVALASQVAADPGSAIAMIGASGAVAGVLGAYFVLFPQASVEVVLPLGFVFVPMMWQARIFLGLWLGGQVVSALASGAGPGVAWWAHIGGFVLGMALARPLAPSGRRILVEFDTRDPHRAWPSLRAPGGSRTVRGRRDTAARRPALALRPRSRTRTDRHTARGTRSRPVTRHRQLRLRRSRGHDAVRRPDRGRLGRILGDRARRAIGDRRPGRPDCRSQGD